MKKSLKTTKCPVHDVKPNQMFNSKKGGGDEIPPGGWRSGSDQIFSVGWRSGGGDEIPFGGWRANFKGGWLTPSSFSETEGQNALVPISTPFESIPYGGFRSAIDVYRTKTGNGYFKFRFYRIGSYYEIDILAMPSYNSRATDCHSTHRLPERGGYKVCMGDPRILTTLTEAKKWAAVWSELTMKYIMYGTSFPNK